MARRSFKLSTATLAMLVGALPGGSAPARPTRGGEHHTSGRQRSRAHPPATPKFRVVRAHSYRGFTTQPFTPGAQLQPQLLIVTSAGGRSIDRIGFVIECSAGPRSGTVFTGGVAIARRSGSFESLATTSIAFANGASEPGKLTFKGTFVGKSKIRGTLVFKSPTCEVHHAAWVAYK